MSDKALEAKFSDLAEGILPAPQARRLMDLCWTVEKLTDASEIARAAARGGRDGRSRPAERAPGPDAWVDHRRRAPREGVSSGGGVPRSCWR